LLINKQGKKKCMNELQIYKKENKKVNFCIFF